MTIQDQYKNPIMEHKKIIDLLGNTQGQPSKFRANI